MQKLQIRVRPETRLKLDAIAQEKRWTLSETADVLADSFMNKEGIKVPQAHARRPRAKQPATT